VAGAFLAEGYSRSSDSVGVINVVPGAGVTNSLSGIAEAWMDTTPMVVLASGIRSDTAAAYQLHAIDQLAILDPVTKAVFRVERADDSARLPNRAPGRSGPGRGGDPGPALHEAAGARRVSLRAGS